MAHRSFSDQRLHNIPVARNECSVPMANSGNLVLSDTDSDWARTV